MNVWTPYNGNYVAEMSDLQSNGLFKNNVVTLPDRSPLSFSSFAPVIHNEELTHWVCTFEGVTYTIYND